MKLSQYNYDFSADLLAKYPTEDRDESRLLVLHRNTGEIEHRVFKDILDYFEEKDVFVFNNTKVFPARLYGNKEKTGAEIEIFLLRELNKDLRLWDVLVDPARKIRIGNKLYFGDDDALVAEVKKQVRGTLSQWTYDRALCDEEIKLLKKAAHEGEAEQEMKKQQLKQQLVGVMSEQKVVSAAKTAAKYLMPTLLILEIRSRSHTFL